MRYLTVVDYSQVPDPNYPLVNVATLDPGLVRTVWIILAASAYCGFLALTAATSRQPARCFGLTEALAFSSLILLQPFSQKYTLVVLMWPAMVAGRICGSHPARGLLYTATAITLAQPILQGAPAQRLMQVLGFDFLSTALLTSFLVISILTPAGAAANSAIAAPNTVSDRPAM
jgi:hypothetical protein